MTISFHLGVPLFVALVGGILYTANLGKWSEVGKMAFVAGLTAFLIGMR